MQANEEQQYAIDLNGNTCLFAGAGAGKTFVIKEHVYRVVKEKTQAINKRCLEDYDFEKSLRSLLQGIAVMTFTKKAAREIKSRIEEKFEQLPIAELSQERRTILQNELPRLYVGTIHSFFYRILREYSLELDAEEIELKDEFEIKQSLSNFLKIFLEDKLEDENFLKISSAHERIASSLYSIINKVDSLTNWQQGEPQYQLKLEDVLRMYELDLSKVKSDIAGRPKDEEKAWYKLLDFINKNIDSVQDMPSLGEFISSFKSIGKYKPRGKVVDEIGVDLNQLTKLIDLSNENGDFLQAYGEDPNYVRYWQNLFYQLLREAIEYLEQKNLLGFSDIERKLSILLSHESIKSAVNQNLNYLVIDEYQDTSQIQYQIVSDLIGGDYSKLYVVGDPKQSIYSFRGGEVNVFFETAKKLKHQAVMKNNYRSSKEVINFNNQLFEILLKELGGGDSSLNLEISQVYGNEKINEGEVSCLVFDGELSKEEAKKFPSFDCEEDFLVKRMRELEHRYPEDQIAVLVRKVKHGLGLAKKLIREGKAVSFQFKLYGNEAPIIRLFQNLLEIALCTDKDYSRILLRIREEVQALDLPTEFLTLEFKQTWQRKIQVYGVTNAFRLFLVENGLSSIGAEEQVDFLEILLMSYSENLDIVWNRLKNLGDLSVPIEVSTSSNPKFFFMTVHASKGLEFDHVILGGLYQSQKGKNDLSFLGQGINEFSFPPKESGSAISTIERKFKNEEIKQVSKEESLRLFYVACTRAVKTLSFVKINNVSPPSGSWSAEVAKLHTEIEKIVAHKNYSFEALEDSKIKKNEEVRLFISDKGESNCIVFPEVSVSKLSDLVVCPKYFYLKNVLKLTPDFQSYASDKVVSSAERGTEIHAVLENYVKNHELITSFDLTWPATKIDSLRDKYELNPEFEVKFEVMGQMISGTIDLVGKNSKEIIVVDYKTGKFNPLQNSKYLMQIILYAKAVQELNPSIEKINLEIWYVDSKKSMTYTLVPEDIHQAISYYWQKMSDYSVQNTSHCNECFLNKICL